MVGLVGDGDSGSVTAARGSRALKVGRAFAEIIRDEPVVRELWVTMDTEEPGVHLWLITDPIDWDKTRDLYESPVDRLFERFPREVAWLHVLNPRHSVGDVHDSLRQDAEQIPLRTG